MKKLRYLLTAVLLTGLLFTAPSCGKYEDGPGFTLLTKKKRLIGDWDLVSTTDSDGTMYADNSSDFISYKKDDVFNATYGNYTIIGSWEFGSGKETIKTTFQIPFTEGQTTTIVTIRRLTNKELWTMDEDGDIFKFEKK